jgi:hypothetical protein
VTGYSTAADGSVAEVQAEADLDFAAGGRKPPKGVLNWVGQPAPGQEPEEAEVSVLSFGGHSVLIRVERGVVVEELSVVLVDLSRWGEAFEKAGARVCSTGWAAGPRPGARGG